MMDKDKIAVIGIGCRFPGGVKDPDTFWRLLINGIDAIAEVPPDRFDINAYYDPKPQTPGKIITRYGGFIEEVDKFDSDFFGISPREAYHLDPQQRLLAEITFEAFQDAGIDPNSFASRKIGVYVGIFSNDYGNSMFECIQDINFYSATGGAHYSASGRLSYLFDLKGPSLTVETACSSSLAAVHLACQSLRTNESEMAVAGGVNLILTPHMSIAFSSGQVLSPEGRCKFGDVSANGFARSEGCGMVVLKLLSKALIDNDRIYAVILGSAINNDGHDGLLVAPSINGQIAVLQDAYRDAGVDPSKVSFIEAHGTGTAIGDPVEMKALGNVIGVHRSRENPCLVGSVKTNIGHGETASGVAGLIKTALCLQHRQIPPSLHFKTPNPKIPWDELNMQMVAELTDIPEGNRPIIAGVNSFGLTGMNAHIVLQEYPKEFNADRSMIEDSRDSAAPLLLPLSAKSFKSLSETVKQWCEYLGTISEQTVEPLYDICYTASIRRTHHEYRLAVVGRTRAELSEKLLDIQRAANAATINREESDYPIKSGLVFVFSGQGPQWFAMGRMLLGQEVVFRLTIERISQLLEAHAGWSLLDEMKADEASSRMDQTAVAQPALFALQMALAALWESWGIRPDAVVGHSIGEVAAACYSGVLSLEDAVRVVYHRGRLLQKAAGQGRMAAVEISPEEAATIIAKYAGRLSIAAFNSPSSVTLSGEPEALEEVLEAVKSRNLFCRMLAVNYAFHSHQVEPYQQEMSQSVQGIRVRAAAIPILSTVTGQSAAIVDFGAAYWAENIRRPVQFAAAIDALIQRGDRTFVELSPHPVLGGSISQCLGSRGIESTPLCSLRRNRDEIETMLETLGALYVQGRHIDWKKLYPNKGRCISLPSYCWEKKSFWIQRHADMTGPTEAGVRENTAPRHYFSGRRMMSPLFRDIVYEYSLDSRCLEGLPDFRLDGKSVLPAGGLIAAILSAAYESFPGKPFLLEDMQIYDPLVLPDEGELHLQIVFKNPGRKEATFEVHRHQSGGADRNEWMLHLSGRLAFPDGFKRLEHCPPSRLLSRDDQIDFGEDLSLDEIRMQLHCHGIDPGDALSRMNWIRRNGKETICQISLTNDPNSSQHPDVFSPVFLEACFLAFITHLSANSLNRTDMPFRLVGLKRITPVSRPETAVICHSEMHDGTDCVQGIVQGNATLYAADGSLCGMLEGLRFQPFSAVTKSNSGEESIGDLLMHVEWHPQRRLNSWLRRRPSDYMPTVKQIVERLEQELPGSVSPREDGLAEGAPDCFDRLSVGYIINSVRELGWNMALGDSATTEELRKRLGIEARHGRLFARMLEILVQDGLLKRVESTWGVAQRLVEQNLQQRWASALSAYPQLESELTLLRRCGSALASVLRGQRDPLELLFPAEAFGSAENLYESSQICRIPNHLICRIGAHLTEKLPHGRVLRVLEIGAGTGGTTSHLLPELPAHGIEYIFSDVSSLFLEKGRKKFTNYPFVRYQLLDIEKEPESQGFAPRQFDVILASNVVHATADLRKSLHHISRLLTESGLMLLVEGVRPTRWIDMIFGQLEGWWKFSDTDLRPGYPLMSADAWKRLLCELPFVEAETILAVNGQAGRLFEQAVVVAKASPESSLVATIADIGSAEGTWLIFADQSGIGRCLAEQVRARGEACLLVYPADAIGHGEEGEVRINPSQSEDYRRIVNGIAEKAPFQLRAVVHLWSLEQETSGRMDSVESLEESITRGCGSALYTLQALAAAGMGGTRLWLVTRGAQSVGDEDPLRHPSQSPIWGVGRTAANEYPDLWGGLVDLDPSGEPTEMAAIMMDIILNPEHEDQFALRGGERFVPRLLPLPQRDAPTPTIGSEGSYLITGGLGDLGLETALWLAKQGARRLILMSRTPLPRRSDWDRIPAETREFRQIAALRALEDAGAEILTASVDVSDEAQLRAFLDGIQGGPWRPVRGVVHAAAQFESRLMQYQDAEGFRSGLRTKVLGAWLLHRLLAAESLDFFIGYSSLASFFGLVGLSSYAAANIFLDAMTHYRRSSGLPTLSVNWGLWSGYGFVSKLVKQRAEEGLVERGVETLSPLSAFPALGMLLKSGVAQGSIAKMNWSKFRKALGAGRCMGLFSHMVALGDAGEEQPRSDRDAPDKSDLHTRLIASTPGAPRRRLMESSLADILGQVLRMKEARIKRDKPFGDYGLDSLMAVELKNRCESELGIPLPATLAWNYPTVAVLAEHLASQLGLLLDEDSGLSIGRSPAATGLSEPDNDHPRGVDRMMESIGQLSEMEALERLLQKPAGSKNEPGH